MTAPEPTNRPAPMTPPSEIIVTCRCLRPGFRSVVSSPPVAAMSHPRSPAQAVYPRRPERMRSLASARMAGHLDAVVFDLDATLTDFDAVEAEVWARTFARLRAALPAVDEASLRRRHLALREPFYDEILAGSMEMAGHRRAHLLAAVEPWGAPA